MLFTDAVFVGIDPTAGQQPIQYAALDRDLHLIVLDQGDLESVLAFVASLESAVVAVDAPQGPSRGLMARADFRQRYNMRPEGSTWAKWRVCEYELRRRNIRLYNTPEKEEEAKAWVRTGFEIFRRLEKIGFRKNILDEKSSRRAIIEARAHSGFTILLERRPFLKRTLEGRLQRQLVLYLEGLDIANPMYALEEITRHNLLSGHLPLDRLHTYEALEAMMAAYTAYLTGLHAERISQVGEREEGLITLPAIEIKDFYQ
jgi:predicted nuclease with RNAse H fold